MRKKMKAIAIGLVLLSSTAHAAQMMIDPAAMAVSGPNLYVADLSAYTIWKVDLPSGSVTKFAGGRSGYTGDGGPATEAGLDNVTALAAGPDGTVYIGIGSRVRKVDSAGIISTVVNKAGAYGSAGNGGPAVNASMRYIRGLAVDGAGNLYLADGDSWVVRKVDRAGVISAFAGNGVRGTGGDGGQATAASFLSPYDVATAADGSVYVLDRPDFAVRRVNPSGVISTVAGQHQQAGFGGDGGPAVAAKLNYPLRVLADSAGNLLILDSNNNRLRKVDTTGTIYTVAGNGVAGYTGDGGPATQASLLWPSSLALDSSGSWYIGNRSTSGQTWDRNNAVRIVSGGTISTLIAYSTQPAATNTPAATATPTGSPRPTSTTIQPTAASTPTSQPFTAPTCEPGCRVGICQ